MTSKADETLARYRALPYRRVVQRVEDPPGEIYYVCTYPELPGLMADGGSPREAQRNGASAFDDYVRAQLHWGLPIPEPEAFRRADGVPDDAVSDGAAEIVVPGRTPRRNTARRRT